MHQTKIHSMGTAASTSSQILKVTKSISRVSFPWQSQVIHLSLNGHIAELLWVPGVCLAVTTAGTNLSHKSDVTKRRSQSCIVTRRHYLVCRSVWKPVALNISQRCLIVWEVLFQLSDGLQHATITLTTFCGHFYHTAKWKKWKVNVKFRPFWVGIHVSKISCIYI